MLTRSNLHSYQHRAIEFIKRHPQCALWVDMGLGKTVSTLTAFADMYRGFECKRMLVVAPLRVARKVWSDEVREWSHLHGLEVARIVGTPQQRVAALRMPADIHTINREQMEWLAAQFVQGKKQIRKWPWDVTVFDESQSFKSSDSVRFRAARLLRKLMQRVVNLTGTPTPNGLHDLWAQFYLLDRGQRLGQGIGDFEMRWFNADRNPDGYTQWTAKASARAEIERLVRDITLSLKAEDYLDLPPVTYNPVRVALDAHTLAKYQRMEQQAIFELQADKFITASNTGALGTKLLQLANGAMYDAQKVWHEIHQEKIDALVELLDSTNGKALIGYGFVHDIERVGAALDKFCGKKKRWTVLRSDESFSEWARGEYDYGVLHPASAGHGLNDVYKSGVETLIWFGLTNNLEYWQQLNARLTGGHRRAGRNVVVHVLVCDETVDVKLVKLIDKKTTSQDDLTRAVADYVKEVL